MTVVYRIRQIKEPSVDQIRWGDVESDGYCYFRRYKSSNGIATVYLSEKSVKKAMSQIWHAEGKYEIVAFNMIEQSTLEL